jgi:hypothetical protein
MSEFQLHVRKGSRRPTGVKKDSIVHAKGGGEEIVQRADRVDWRNVSSWAYTDKPLTKIVDYAFCDGVCDD